MGEGMLPFLSPEGRKFHEEHEAIKKARHAEMEELYERQTRERVTVHARFKEQFDELYDRYGLDPVTGEIHGR